jgi:hypothetical protein
MKTLMHLNGGRNFMGIKAFFWCLEFVLGVFHLTDKLDPVMSVNFHCTVAGNLNPCIMELLRMGLTVRQYANAMYGQ